MTTKMALAGLNIYTIIAVLVAAALLFHVTKVEESFMLMIAIVVVIYLIR